MLRSPVQTRLGTMSCVQLTPVSSLKPAEGLFTLDPVRLIMKGQRHGIYGWERLEKDVGSHTSRLAPINPVLPCETSAL